jgi:uncharacterized damage-inducible protein DinB
LALDPNNFHLQPKIWTIFTIAMDLRIALQHSGEIMKSYFQQLAKYNQWTNERLYAAVLELPSEMYRKPIGVFFVSLHGTLNHLLLTDRMWFKRLTGVGEELPNQLNAILFEDRQELAAARAAEDKRIIDVTNGYQDADLLKKIKYANTSGKQFEAPLSDLLMHIFNHQTHHRGQAHSCLSILTEREPPSLDLLAMQRGAPSPNLSALLNRSV